MTGDLCRPGKVTHASCTPGLKYSPFWPFLWAKTFLGSKIKLFELSPQSLLAVQRQQRIRSLSGREFLLPILRAELGAGVGLLKWTGYFVHLKCI